MKDPVVVDLNEYMRTQKEAEAKRNCAEGNIDACVDEVINVMTYHDYTTAIDTLNNDELGTLLQTAVVAKNTNMIGHLFLKVLRESEEVKILSTYMAEERAGNI